MGFHAGSSKYATPTSYVKVQRIGHITSSWRSQNQQYSTLGFLQSKVSNKSSIRQQNQQVVRVHKSCHKLPSHLRHGWKYRRQRRWANYVISATNQDRVELCRIIGWQGTWMRRCVRGTQSEWHFHQSTRQVHLQNHEILLSLSEIS